MLPFHIHVQARADASYQVLNYQRPISLLYINSKKNLILLIFVFMTGYSLNSIGDHRLKEGILVETKDCNWLIPDNMRLQAFYSYDFHKFVTNDSKSNIATDKKITFSKVSEEEYEDANKNRLAREMELIDKGDWFTIYHETIYLAGDSFDYFLFFTNSELVTLSGFTRNEALIVIDSCVKNRE